MFELYHIKNPTFNSIASTESYPLCPCINKGCAIKHLFAQRVYSNINKIISVISTQMRLMPELRERPRTKMNQSYLIRRNKRKIALSRFNHITHLF